LVAVRLAHQGEAPVDSTSDNGSEASVGKHRSAQTETSRPAATTAQTKPQRNRTVQVAGRLHTFNMPLPVAVLAVQFE
jgi:hypothetical protein